MDAERKSALYFALGLVCGSAVTICATVLLTVRGTDIVSVIRERVNPEPNEDIQAEQENAEPTEKQSHSDHSSLDDNPVTIGSVRYDTVIDSLGYSGDDKPDKEQDVEKNEPHRITENEFIEAHESGIYDVRSFTLYGDYILADAVSDERIFESEAFSALGANNTVRDLRREFDRGADMIFIRNENLFTQYEIDFNPLRYGEVTGLEDYG
jgi:hypothetical protein